MNFKFSTNFLLPYARKPAKYGGCGSTGLDATPTVQIHTGRPVHVFGCKSYKSIFYWMLPQTVFFFFNFRLSIKHHTHPPAPKFNKGGSSLACFQLKG